MTIIVGIPHNGRVYMGADSQSTGGELVRHAHEPKVWRSAGMVFGKTGSPRGRQILEYATKIPKRSGDLHAWLCTEFVAAIRQGRKDGGYEARFPNGPECGPWVIIGAEGRLFVMYTDYQVSEYPLGAAIGSGETVALGALFATRGLKMAPRRRIDLALQAACAHNTNCGGPFRYASAK